MRIGIYAGIIQDRHLGGGHTFEITFIEALLKLESKHIFYLYYIADKKLPYDDTAVVKFRKIDNGKIYKRFCGIKIRQKGFNLEDAVKEDCIDIAYYIAPYYKNLQVPMFITVWDLGHRTVTAFPEVSANENFELREKLYGEFLPKATKIIVGNEEGKKDICKYYNVNPNNVITNPLPTPEYVYSTHIENNVLKKYNLQKKDYFFYPAQFWAHKNHIRILKAINILKEKGLDVKMVFTGSDKGNAEYIKEKVKEYGLNENVIFLGFIEKSEIVDLYKNAAALVYASFLGPDNLPPLEAMALGCPVLVSDIPGHRIQLKDCAEFFNPCNEADLADKISKVLENRYSFEMLEKGKSLAQTYSVNNYLLNILKVFDDFECIRECWRMHD